MKQLSIWDIENVGVKIHDSTGAIIKLGDELTLVRFEVKSGDHLENSVVVDKVSEKLYLKQESRRKEPFQFIDWPMVTFIEIDWDCFRNGYILEVEIAERAKRRNGRKKELVLNEKMAKVEEVN